MRFTYLSLVSHSRTSRYPSHDLALPCTGFISLLLCYSNWRRTLDPYWNAILDVSAEVRSLEPRHAPLIAEVGRILLRAPGQFIKVADGDPVFCVSFVAGAPDRSAIPSAGARLKDLHLDSARRVKPTRSATSAGLGYPGCDEHGYMSRALLSHEH
jgi:hypothetical protein